LKVVLVYKFVSQMPQGGIANRMYSIIYRNIMSYASQHKI